MAMTWQRQPELMEEAREQLLATWELQREQPEPSMQRAQQELVPDVPLVERTELKARPMPLHSLPAERASSSQSLSQPERQASRVVRQASQWPELGLP